MRFSLFRCMARKLLPLAFLFAASTGSVASAQIGGPFDGIALSPGLPLSGGALTGTLLLPDGTVGAPAMAFASEPGTGFRWTSSSMRASILGVSRWTLSAASMDLGIPINMASNHVYSNNQLLELGGNMTTTHALGTGDVGVAGDLEVDGDLYADGALVVAGNTTSGGSINLVNEKFYHVGSAGVVRLGYYTNQTNDGVFFEFGSGAARTLMITELGDPGVDYGIPVATDPTVRIQSADATDVTQYLALHHDQTNGRLDTGKGGLRISNALFLDETTTPTAVAGSGALYTKTDNVLYFQDGAGDEHAIGGDVPTFISFSHSTGASGVHWMGGFYDAPVAEAVLTQSATTQTHGTAASGARGAHAFFVSKQAGNVDAGSASVVVSGTSITDAGVRTTSDTETIIADITAESVNNYSETSKKWLGQVTYTITPAGAGTYDLSGNFGFNKYDDLGNRDFTVTDFECVFEGGATDTGLDIELLHHQSAAWTYHASAFVPGNGALASCATDYSTDCKVISGEFNAYKRGGLSTAITGANGEGFLIRLTTATNNSINSIDCRTGVQF